VVLKPVLDNGLFDGSPGSVITEGFRAARVAETRVNRTATQQDDGVNRV
jgi:hypothetical protein